MADIRIKDITTTASASLTGDFLPIDGSTGTRKLSAFSPTFGGNATVTGTLTVNGVATAGSYLTSAAGLTFPGALSANGYYLYSGSANGLTMYGYGSTYDVYIGNRAGTRALSVAANSTVVSIPDTTASTTTSSGALVVSGGVGVAKEMYIGGGLLNVAKGGAGSTIEINADSGFASKLAMQRAATNRWTLEVDSSDVLTIKSLGTTAALTMTGTTSAEFVGSIKTAAPSGGTAANWKLGTVATVSPTSPNRTIEVDIGGTIYYIHAKTTNN